MPSESLSLKSEYYWSVVRQARGTLEGLRQRRLWWRGTLLYASSTPLALASLIALASGKVSTALSTVAAFALIATGTRRARRARTATTAIARGGQCPRARINDDVGAETQLTSS